VFASIATGKKVEGKERVMCAASGKGARNQVV